MSKFIEFIRKSISQSPYIAALCRYIYDNLPIMGKERETPMGFKFIGSAEMEKGDHEPWETEIAKRMFDKVDVVVNVGAHIGYYCCLALQKGKHVIAFEPIPSNLRYLYRNIIANHWQDKIEIFPIALSNRIGIIEMFWGGTRASLIKGWAKAPEQYSRLVPTSTLDNILGSRCHGKRCFFLVDIEGAEGLMLEGASLSLSGEPKPIWMVEICVSTNQPKNIAINPRLLSTFQAFWDRGYDAFEVDKQLRLVQPNEVQTILLSGKDSFSSHNFLFIEHGKSGEILDC